MKKQFSFLLYFLIFAFIFFYERATKWWAYHVLADQSLNPMPGLQLTLIWNKGISWSLFTPKSFFALCLLIGLICIIIVIFLLYTVAQYRKKISIFFEIFVIAGAFSNLLDRLLFGSVIDFIECSIGSWSWPVFNGADVLVVIGIFGIIIRNWREGI